MVVSSPDGKYCSLILIFYCFIVIKLFNAILQASATHQTDAATLAIEANPDKRKKKEKDNVLGRGGKDDRLTKEGFLDMIKSGGK